MTVATTGQGNSLTHKVIKRPSLFTLGLVAMAVAVVGLVVREGAQYKVIDFMPVTYNAAVDVFMPILFVSLLVERTLEVFVATGRKLHRVPLERAVLKAEERYGQLKDRISVFQAQIDAPGSRDLSEAQLQPTLQRLDATNKLLAQIQNAVRDAHAAMEKYKSETQRLTFVIGSLIGLLIGLAGMRILAPLVDLQLAGWSDFQLFAFHSIDVVLTAALLAGGASGIHEVIAMFSDYTAKSRRSVRA